MWDRGRNIGQATVFVLRQYLLSVYHRLSLYIVSGNVHKVGGVKEISVAETDDDSPSNRPVRCSSVIRPTGYLSMGYDRQ